MISIIDNLWLLVASILVLLMQAGFLLLEGGRVRAKNSINVAQKNITDLVVAWVCFMTVGLYIMYGQPGLAGDPASTSLVRDDGSSVGALYWLYQLCFCSTAVTVLSGAVAERLSYRAFLCIVVAISAFIYPLVGRLARGDYVSELNFTLLHDMGFIDFAGATTVHGVGAWAGLVIALLLGPRIGRFDEQGKVRSMPAYSSVISLLGALLLLVGWIGFNGGSVSPADPLLTIIAYNTLTAAAFGALAGMLIAHHFDAGIFRPEGTINGLLGGLVATTAGIHLMTQVDAALVGILGGSTAVVSAHLLLHRAKLDDPIDAIACHGVAGAVGTLAVAFVAPTSALVAGSRLTQLAVQATGVVTVFLIVCTTTWLIYRITNRIFPCRIDAESEVLGLNYTEHGESIGSGRLQRALEDKLLDNAYSNKHVQVTDNDEHAELTETINQLIDKQEAAAEAVRQSEIRFRQLAESSSDWLWETNTELIITYMTPSQHENATSLASHAPGRRLTELLKVEPTLEHQLQHCFERRLPTGLFEARIVSDGGNDDLHVQVRGVPDFNETGVFTGYRGTISNISDRVAAEQRTEFVSRHDELTGLPNRRVYNEDLTHCQIQAIPGQLRVAVIKIEFSDWHNVVDGYGLAAADQVLCDIAKQLQTNVGDNNTIYRVDNTGFVAVLCRLDNNAPLPVLQQQLTQIINQGFESDTRSGSPQLDAGIAVYPDHAENPDQLLRLAQLALRAPKDNNSRNFTLFEADMDRVVRERLEMGRELRKAIDEGQFYLAYQPQVDVHTEDLVGFEALIRWRHPQRGEVPPGAFIGTAEELDMMGEIGAIVLDKACQFAAKWEQKGHNPMQRVAVNVSPQQFKDDAFVDRVLETLQRHQLPPQRLELEITEDLLVHDFDAVVAILEELRAAGISVAIDDFGSGQTSLRYLSQFPVSMLKIDRSFIRHLGEDAKANEITKSLISLGKRLQLTVLAEGIEEQRQLDLLRNWQCDQAQGFYFAKPLPEAEVETLIMTRSEDKGENRKSA